MSFKSKLLMGAILGIAWGIIYNKLKSMNTEAEVYYVDIDGDYIDF